MSKSIVSALTHEELIALFRKEAKIAVNGSVEFSRKGIARLVGKNKQTIQNLLSNIRGGKNLSSTLQKYSGCQFSGAEIPETVVWAVISHYARKGIERCQDLQDLLGSVGLRQSVHLAQNWETNQSSVDRVAYRYLLPIARTWDKQFPDEFYSELERLTNIHPEGANRPHYWAQLTNEFVYSYLPCKVAEGVRAAKSANASSDKLHQFLSTDGLELLQNHLNALMILLSAAGSIDDVRAMAVRRFAGQYQQALVLKY
jgi:P63C domain